MILLPWRWQALNLKIIYRNKLMISFYFRGLFELWVWVFTVLIHCNCDQILESLCEISWKLNNQLHSFPLGLWFQPSLLDSLMKQHIWPLESTNHNLFILLRLLHLVAKSFKLGRLECLWGCVLQLALLGIQLESFPNNFCENFSLLLCCWNICY